MENENNLCLTPKRASYRGVLRERQPHVETRRSLFEKGESDLSDISPLSRTSSELMSPVRKSPIKVRSPLRMRGIALLSPDHGIIKPRNFYGKSASPSLNGAELYRQIRQAVSENCKARTCLFLDDLPRNKKRSRSSGNPNESIKQVKKKLKLQPNLRHDVRKPSKSEIRQREKLKKKKALKELKERRIKEKMEQLKQEKGKRKYNWEIFNTSEDLNRLTSKSSVIMTPPHSSKKKKLLNPRHFEFPSPDKLNSSVKVNGKDILESDEKKDENLKAHEDLVKEIREGVLDMMKDDDDEDDEVAHEVSALLDKLGGDDDLFIEDDKEHIEKVEEKYSLNSGGDNTENVGPSTPQTEKLYSIFSYTPRSTVSMSPLNKTELTPFHKKKFGLGMDQLQLDVGQNNLREIECDECGLMYVQGNPEDMEEHKIFHYKFKELHFKGWKNERVVRYDGFNKIICVRSADIRQWWKKANNVLDIIDSELGYPPCAIPTAQIYMYVAGKFVRGVVAVSHISKAYKMLHMEGSSEVGLCSEEEYPVKCLISRIWVDRHFRRCNIASALLDSVRSNFTFGYILKCNDLAFSSPTDDGRKFIEAYAKTKEYFVYTF